NGLMTADGAAAPSPRRAGAALRRPWRRRRLFLGLLQRIGMGLAEIVALGEGDADALEGARVVLILDHLADRGDADLAAEAGDRAQQEGVALVAQGRPPEAAVDLDEIDLEAAQVVERVGAGAEIVEADLEAAAAQRLDAGIDVLDAGDLRRFGDL